MVKIDKDLPLDQIWQKIAKRMKKKMKEWLVICFLRHRL